VWFSKPERELGVGDGEAIGAMGAEFVGGVVEDWGSRECMVVRGWSVVIGGVGTGKPHFSESPF